MVSICKRHLNIFSIYLGQYIIQYIPRPTLQLIPKNGNTCKSNFNFSLIVHEKNLRKLTIH